MRKSQRQWRELSGAFITFQSRATIPLMQSYESATMIRLTRDSDTSAPLKFRTMHRVKRDGCGGADGTSMRPDWRWRFPRGRRHSAELEIRLNGDRIAPHRIYLGARLLIILGGIKNIFRGSACRRHDLARIAPCLPLGGSRIVAEFPLSIPGYFPGDQPRRFALVDGNIFAYR